MVRIDTKSVETSLDTARKSARATMISIFYEASPKTACATRQCLQSDFACYSI
jgi:hypothetical protein